ncbi:MAG: hypothetical protein OXC60_10600 [Litoreibacter sp.]|nr:hypothetical protein [Litoreibacter sp.]
MGQIWLHIGSPKTGTTSLQGFLGENHQQLRDEAGINFMQTGRSHIAHNQIATAARMGELSLFDQIAAEADESPEENHVLSSELLFNPHVAYKVTQAVPDSWKGGRTKVICYIRRHDAYLEALYKQYLKNNRIPPDRQAFLADAPRLLRYFDVINAYGRAFGRENIILRPFSPDHLKGRDVILDFAALVGFEVVEGMSLTKAFANKSFSAAMSETLSMMTKHTEFNTREVIRELMAVDHPGTVRSRDVFTKAERKALMERMAPDTQKLIKRYMPDHAAFFDYTDLENCEDEPEPPLSAQLEDRTAAAEAIMKAIGNIQRRHAAQNILPMTQPMLDAETAPPSWYTEIYPAGARDGWFHKSGDYSCSYVERERDQLVISFDNLSQAGNVAYAREPWAQKFCQDRNFSHLGIYAQAPTWFRDPGLIEKLQHLARDGFFKDFRSVAFIGTSMGAFGALTFSSLAPGSTVIAFSPQTTLDVSKVPWEQRFAAGRAADWSLPHADAVAEVATAARVYLIYDPFHAADRAHIDRLTGPNLIHLKGIGLGHKSALVLNRMGRLKGVMEDGIAGTLTPAGFYKMLRARKDVYLYRQTMEGHLTARGKPAQAKRFGEAFIKRRRLLSTG